MTSVRKAMKKRVRPPHKPYSYANPRPSPPSPNHSLPINLNDLGHRFGAADNTTPLQLKSSSYVSLLPPEILAEIFMFCLPADQFPIASRADAPLLLTQVSSFWRSVATSTPDLWVAFHINYKDSSEDISLANMWLSHSSTRSLSLSIAIDFGEQPHQEMIETLCRHSKRWKHVRFDFRHLLCPLMYSLDTAFNDVPQLATFEFHARDISSANISPITRFLSSAPNLREISWVDDLADMDTLLELPLGRLARLSLSMENGTLDYLQVLNQCHNLEHIRITKPLLHTTQPGSPLFLSKLSSLNIASDLTSVLNHLILPALREVRIYSDYDKQALSHTLWQNPWPHGQYPPNSPPTGSWDPTPFLSLVERSSCTITSLLVTPPMTEGMLLMCLRWMGSSLVKLSVEGVGIGDMVLGSLTRPSCRSRSGVFSLEEENTHYDDQEFMCPMLEEMTLDTVVDCSPDALSSMIESRLRPQQHSPSQHSSSQCHDRPHGDERTWAPIKKLRIVDGHKDLEKLQVLSQASSVYVPFILDIIPKKITRTLNRNYFFRRKLCASR